MIGKIENVQLNISNWIGTLMAATPYVQPTTITCCTMHCPWTWWSTRALNGVAVVFICIKILASLHNTQARLKILVVKISFFPGFRSHAIGKLRVDLRQEKQLEVVVAI